MPDRKILLIGRLPPPVGGVTTYNSRLLDYSKKLNYNLLFLSKIYDFNIIIKFLKRKYINKINYVILISTTSISLVFFGYLLSIISKSKVSVILHGNLKEIFALSNFPFKRFLLNKFKRVCLLNKNSLILARKIGLTNVKKISSFIPPLNIYKQDSLKYQTNYELNQLKNNGICNKIMLKNIKGAFILTSAWSREFDKNNNEIYGINNIIETLVNSKINLIISDPSKKYFDYFKKKLKDGHLEEKYKFYLSNYIYFLNVKHELYKVISLADIFIRNTSTDGDSISVHEALFFKTQVLATNVIDRPEGVICYKNLNIRLIKNNFTKKSYKNCKINNTNSFNINSYLNKIF